MRRAPVFLDTAGLFGAFYPSDELHVRSWQVLDALALDAVPLVSSDLVVVEFLNATSAIPSRVEAVRFVRALMESPGVSVIPLDRAGLLESMRLYEARPDKSWSIVDCWSMLICREMGIEQVFTRDHHFRQAGFEILL